MKFSGPTHLNLLMKSTRFMSKASPTFSFVSGRCIVTIVPIATLTFPFSSFSFSSPATKMCHRLDQTVAAGLGSYQGKFHNITPNSKRKQQQQEEETHIHLYIPPASRAQYPECPGTCSARACALLCSSSVAWCRKGRRTRGTARRFREVHGRNFYGKR